MSGLSFLKTSVDETAISDGELYTIVSNPEARGGKGSLVALVKDIKAQDVIDTLKLIPEDLRSMVKEVTMDLSNSMNLIVRRCFPKANRTIDRFHVQKLACDALQEMRIAHRWMPYRKKPMPWRKPGIPERNTTPLLLLMETQENNYWPEDVTCIQVIRKMGSKPETAGIHTFPAISGYKGGLFTDPFLENDLQ